MPLGSERYRRAADPDIDYDYDDSIENTTFEEHFADLDSVEADNFPPPPPKLELNLNVYLDANWVKEFGRIGGSASAKRILKQAAQLWTHESLNTKIDLLYDIEKLFVSNEHLLPSQTVYNNNLLGQLVGPDLTPAGDSRRAHLYLTATHSQEAPGCLGCPSSMQCAGKLTSLEPWVTTRGTRSKLL